METAVFALIIIIFVLMNGLDVVTNILNQKAKRREIPDSVSDIYDEESYDEWLRYGKERERLKFLKSGVSFVVILFLLAFGGFRLLAEWTMDLSDSIYVQTLVFIGVLSGASYLFSIPLSYYETFSIEERYGFNRSMRKTFVKDQFMKLLLTVVLGGGLLVLIVAIYETFGASFFLVAFIAIMAIFLFINMFYTKLLLPLFNTLTPLEKGSLKGRIETLAASEDYEVRKISVMDASKRSSRLNAFFSGFSRFKHVVLFDTLLEKMEEDEILAVLAHEIAHSKHKDVIKNILMSALSLFVLLSLLYLFITQEVVYAAFSLEQLHFGFGLILFSIVINPITLFIGIFRNHLSRKYEFKADTFAGDRVGKDAMQRALKTLARANYAHLTPHEFHVFLHYSHPPVKDRIEALEALDDKK